MKFLPIILVWFFLVTPSLSAVHKHYGPSVDRNTRNALDKFGEALAKPYQFKLLISGCGGIVGSTSGLWALHFTSQKKMTLDQARPLAVHMANELINFMFASPLFAEYMKLDRKGSLTLDCIGYKIAFWDENVDRPLRPYLAEIRLRDGELYYYYADPETQALQAPLVEPIN